MTVPKEKGPPRLCPPERCGLMRLLVNALPEGVDAETALGEVLSSTLPHCAHLAKEVMARSLDKTPEPRPNSDCGMNSFDQADAKKLAARAIAAAGHGSEAPSPEFQTPIHITESVPASQDRPPVSFLQQMLENCDGYPSQGQWAVER